MFSPTIVLIQSMYAATRMKIAGKRLFQEKQTRLNSLILFKVIKICPFTGRHILLQRY